MSASAITSLDLALVAPREDAAAKAAFERLSAWTRANAGVALGRVPAASYEELTIKVRSGDCHLAWLPPVVYAWLAEAVNPIGRVVRGGGTTYASALVVSEGSDVRSLEELRGKRAGWVDRWSAGGFVVPRIELARKGLDPTKLFASERFFGTHHDAVRALGRGECDVAATYARRGEGEGEIDGPWAAIPDVNVRVVALLGAIPSDVIAARRNLGPVEYELAAELFRKVGADASGRALLAKVFNGEELAEGVEAGHDALRLAYESALAGGLFD
jgi:ABC-type phosphate/phosphonate transport system substrate-binding protein